MATTTAKEAAAGDLPDGLHAIPAVAYLAAAGGYEADKLPGVVILGEEMGFSRVTGFVKSSGGKGYYLTTEEACTCPGFRFRGSCRHQKRLQEALTNAARRGLVRSGSGRVGCGEVRSGAAIRGEEREEVDSSPKLPAGVAGLSDQELEERAERISRRNEARREARTAARPSTATGFNCPDEVVA